MTWQDGLQFLGFSVFFAVGLVLIGLAVSLCIYAVSAALSTDHTSGKGKS